MGIDQAAFLAGDVYIDFPYEEVLFRYEKASGKVYRKFYGEWVESEIPHSNKLYSEARIAGALVAPEVYSKGHARRNS